MKLSFQLNKIIHFIWIAPDESNMDVLPFDCLSNIEAFSLFHPEYDIEVWTQEKINRFFSDDSELLYLMRRCKFEAMKSDLMRVAIINRFGGIYSDLKNRPNSRFLDQLSEFSDPVILEHPPTIKNSKGIICNAFLQCQSKHIFIQKTLEIISSNIANNVVEGGVTNITGANTWKRGLLQSKSFANIIPQHIAWGNHHNGNGWMKRTTAKYNGLHMENHWSKRQLVESLYNGDDQ